MPDGKSSFTVGRNQDCDIPIADDSVSRIHADLTLEADRLRVTDRQSRNGTRLIRNRKTTQLKQEYVLPTDELQFGEVTLSVSDLLSAIRQKYPAPPAAAKSPAAVKTPDAAPRMVRCACGFVRRQDQPCPECSA